MSNTSLPGTCPSCAVGQATRHGSRMRKVIGMNADRCPVVERIAVQRWRCVACGTCFSDNDPALPIRAMVSLSTRDEVAMECFRTGWAGTGRRFGMDPKTARALWEDWAASHERHDVTAPEALGLHLVTIAGRSRTLVTDVRCMTVVDVLEGSCSMSIRNWLERATRHVRVRDAVVGFHQPFREALAQACPGVHRMTCTGHARRQGMRAFMLAFSSLRKASGRKQGRNGRGCLTTFSGRRTSLSDGAREDMGGWEQAILMLYEAKERFCDALEAHSPRAASPLLAESASLCLGMTGRAAVPHAFLSSWKDDIARGVGERGMDDLCDGLDALDLAWSSRRPSLGFSLSRGLVMLLPPTHAYMPLAEAVACLS